MAEPAKSTMHVMSTTCATCGKKVGLMWFQGRSTLFDGPIGAEGDHLVVTKHQCPGLPAGDGQGRKGVRK